MKISQSGPDFTEFYGDERGATAIEYAMIAGLISIVILGTLSLVGSAVFDFFNIVYEAMIP